MSHAIALLLCLAGFAALACATDRQQHDLFGRELAPAATRMFQAIGATLLLAALGVLVGAQGWALALVMLSGHTSLAAGLVYAALIARERRGARQR